MKKVLLICFLLIAISNVTYAQGGELKSNTPAQQTENLKKLITGITADQTLKITAIYKAQSKTVDSLLTYSLGDQDPLGGRSRQIKTATAIKIKAILSKEQLATYQKYLDEQEAKFDEEDK